jgi:hypothetical protein
MNEVPEKRKNKTLQKITIFISLLKLFFCMNLLRN